MRVLAAKDLFLNQAALTGEALPVERSAAPAPAAVDNPLDLPNLCFLGSNVESGSASAVVIHTGDHTLIIVASSAWLTVSPLAGALGFVPLQALYWIYLALMLLGYALLTQIVKPWFVGKFGE